MIDKNGTITIGNWTRGIASSSANGLADMRSFDPFRKPGYLELSLEMINEGNAQISSTFTANAATDTVTTASSFRRTIGNNQNSELIAVTVSNSGGALPAGLTAGTIYYLHDTGANTATLYTAINDSAVSGSVVDITGAGTGTHTMTTVNMGTPRYIVRDSTYSRLWLQDSNGRVWTKLTSISENFWKLASGNTLTNASGNGLAVWKGYLLVFRNTIIDYFNLSSSTLTGGWTNGWKSSLNLNVYATTYQDHFPFVSGDDHLYFLGTSSATTGYNTIGRIVEIGTFDPASAATYNYTDNALDIPWNVTCGFDDLGNKLIIGTTNKLITWDRTSAVFDIPITPLEPYIQCMRSFNNVLFFSSGVKANIYKTYGTTVEKFIDLPDEFLQSFQYSAVVRNITFNSNELLFWVDGASQSVSGLYAVDLASGAVHMKYQPSQGSGVSLGGSSSLLVYSTGTDNDAIYIGYANGGIAYIDSDFAMRSTRWTETRYGSYLIDQQYLVGTFERPRTFQKIQILLAKPLISGQGIRVSARKNLSDSFTTVYTFDYDTIGSTTAWEAPVNVETTQFIQFKVEGSSGSSAPTTSGVTNYNYNTPTLQSIIIY